MKAKYFLGHAIDGYAFIGRKGSATNREDEPRPVSTIAPMTLKAARKMLEDFNSHLA